jgi:hypothetical protein
VNKVDAGAGQGLAYAGRGPIPKQWSSRVVHQARYIGAHPSLLWPQRNLVLATSAGITRDGGSGGDGPESSASYDSRSSYKKVPLSEIGALLLG